MKEIQIHISKIIDVLQRFVCLGVLISLGCEFRPEDSILAPPPDSYTDANPKIQEPERFRYSNRRAWEAKKKSGVRASIHDLMIEDLATQQQFTIFEVYPELSHPSLANVNHTCDKLEVQLNEILLKLNLPPLEVHSLELTHPLSPVLFAVEHILHIFDSTNSIQQQTLVPLLAQLLTAVKDPRRLASLKFEIEVISRKSLGDEDGRICSDKKEVISTESPQALVDSATLNRLSQLQAMLKGEVQFEQLQTKILSEYEEIWKVHQQALLSLEGLINQVRALDSHFEQQSRIRYNELRQLVLSQQQPIQLIQCNGQAVATRMSLDVWLHLQSVELMLDQQQAIACAERVVNKSWADYQALQKELNKAKWMTLGQINVPLPKFKQGPIDATEIRLQFPQPLSLGLDAISEQDLHAKLESHLAAVISELLDRQKQPLIDEFYQLILQNFPKSFSPQILDLKFKTSEDLLVHLRLIRSAVIESKYLHTQLFALPKQSWSLLSEQMDRNYLRNKSLSELQLLAP